MTEPQLIQVVSNYAYVLREFLDNILRQFPTMQLVYDEQLSYESAFANYRANQNMLNETDDFLPAFAFKRSVLNWQEAGVARRGITTEAINVQPDDMALRYISVPGRLNVEFLYIDVTAEDVEKFELIYLAEALLNKRHQLQVTIPEIGEFAYNIVFNPLESKVLNIEGNYYKGVTGSVDIRGNYLLFTGTSPVIKEINATVMNWYEQVYFTKQITA